MHDGYLYMDEKTLICFVNVLPVIFRRLLTMGTSRCWSTCWRRTMSTACCKTGILGTPQPIWQP